LEFSTFNPKFFLFFKFRAENFSAREISIRKNPGGRNFSASEPNMIGRTGFCRGPCATSEECGNSGVFPDFDAIGRKIFGIFNFRAGKNPGIGGK